MVTVYIGIGSNLGDRLENCMKAVGLLRSYGLTILKESSAFETEPWAVTDQPRFINMAVEAVTSLPPRALLKALKEIEDTIGRTISFRWGPRIIDLDILLYGDMTLAEPDLIIPHPLMHKRLFVLEPLAEIAPEVVHPHLKKNIFELMLEAKKTGPQL